MAQKEHVKANRKSEKKEPLRCYYSNIIGSFRRSKGRRKSKAKKKKVNPTMSI